jgi:hypothetical protein
LKKYLCLIIFLSKTVDIMKLGAVVYLSSLWGSVSGGVCGVGSPQECTDESSCVGASGIWVPVADAVEVPGTAVQGGRRYTLGQSDEEFTTVISAPNGGYCTRQLSGISTECQGNATECLTMDSCFYRNNGGRWYRSSESETCVDNCSHPLVFCDKSRCQSALGCSWFIKTQSNSDQCFCIENPGIYGNPPARDKLGWIFWDQPVSLPIFIIAIIAGLAIAWNVWVFNIKPFFLKIFKKKPKE